jgi:hypothetical protein
VSSRPACCSRHKILAVCSADDSKFYSLSVSVSIPTRYGLESPGIEFRWGRDFPHMSKLGLGPPSLLYNRYRLSFPEIKRLGRGVNHPPHLAPRLKKEKSCTSAFPLGLHGLFLGRTLHFFTSPAEFLYQMQINTSI